jgi:predicted extracellular nuclease
MACMRPCSRHLPPCVRVLAWIATLALAGMAAGAVARGPASVVSAAPAEVGGSLRVATANVDNFFSTLHDGAHACAPRGQAADCRGARDAAEFGRRREQLVDELVALDADILGLEEIENNGPVALQSLVDGMNARVGAAAWRRVEDPREGAGGDAIKVALVYRAARVRPLGAARSGLDPAHLRPPLAQVFEALGAEAGARLVVIVSHFKSRRCFGALDLDLDRGEDHSCFGDRRLLEAQALQRFAAQVRREAGVDDALLIGDLNAHPREAPLRWLLGHGFVDALARFQPAAYSYVFDGVPGLLDHVLASAALAPRITGVTVWHVNTDQATPAARARDPPAHGATPYRASDHDPVLVGLRLRR